MFNNVALVILRTTFDTKTNKQSDDKSDSFGGRLLNNVGMISTLEDALSALRKTRINKNKNNNNNIRDDAQ